MRFVQTVLALKHALRVGIDEKVFAKGHDYMTLLYDLDNSTVEAISDGRDTDSGGLNLEVDPKYFQPTEKEVGDIVLWAKRSIVLFEVTCRDTDFGPAPKGFGKNIGCKRDQLLHDFEIFNDPNIGITLENEAGEHVAFDKSDILPVNIYGVVIVDCKDTLDSLHFGTIKKTLDGPLPVAVMKQTDFADILSEIDTVSDLVYYLNDRFLFLQKVFPESPQPFLDLNRQI